MIRADREVIYAALGGAAIRSVYRCPKCGRPFKAEQEEEACAHIAICRRAQPTWGRKRRRPQPPRFQGLKGMEAIPRRGRRRDDNLAGLANRRSRGERGQYPWR